MSSPSYFLILIPGFLQKCPCLSYKFSLYTIRCFSRYRRFPLSILPKTTGISKGMTSSMSSVNSVSFRHFLMLHFNSSYSMSKYEISICLFAALLSLLRLCSIVLSNHQLLPFVVSIFNVSTSVCNFVSATFRLS